ncbi:laccase-14-like [Mangifera indica]|uniref:laccase-14-like n=1 Tax=Mangifera indica TaxID=29780 RepID=UPI001CFAA0FA|nr:laccase-14-like [Mangifera indica]
MKVSCLQVFSILLFAGILHCRAHSRYTFVVEETRYTRLCSNTTILTVNGKYPGPTIHVHRGDTIIVDVINKAKYNITIHWHGVMQPRNPWSDGPEWITQCPIQPGAKFTQTIIFSTEEGTLWWHAHSDWARATVHGAVVIYPQKETTYPFPKPHAEVPIILGNWWKSTIYDVYNEFLRIGGDPNASDAYTINGQPGDLYPCSSPGTFTLNVDYGLTYLLRLINAAMQDMLFFAVANHSLTVVGSDASYTKPFTSDYITISPGQTIDVLLHADQMPGRYYMAAKAYASTFNYTFDRTTTTAIIQYSGNCPPSSTPSFPNLPVYNDTNASVSFTGRLRSLADENHPVDVPMNITQKLFYTVSVNSSPCPSRTCSGPNGTRLYSSVNNISFVNPSMAILEAYYKGINGVFGTHFPDVPPMEFNYTAEYLPFDLQAAQPGTEVKVLDYGSTIEIVFQGTSLIFGADNPMHLHGFSFYVVGWGLGTFNKDKDPLTYNLVDPPLQNTIAVPIDGWTTIRFKADNPGVWFMHCHLDRHASWGMNTVFIVRNGKASNARMLPPPRMPPC